MSSRIHRAFAALLAAVLLAVLPVPGRAADPYEVNAILSLTGNVAFVGTTQLQALKAVEAYVNQNGGINGRPLSFVVPDDQSNAQTAVQLARTIIAKGVPIILGPSGSAGCAAIQAQFAATVRYFREGGIWRIASRIKAANPVPTS
jgi:branched-chain amino acid transport system substrate-binding protein